MIVVTGGGSGIGRALAQTLANKAERVLIVGRRKSMLEETAATSRRIEILEADISALAGQEALLTRVRHASSLKAIVHNAGTIAPIVPLTNLALEDWRAAFKVNVEAPLFLTQALFNAFQDFRVLNISSGAAHFPVKAWGSYCASKASLSMVTRLWQEEQPAFAIASVMPGIIDTDMQAFIRDSKGMDTEKQAFFLSLKAKQQLLDAATVAQFLSWLLLCVPSEEYRSQEWDIYDKRHHHRWLAPPHTVAHWEAS